MLPTSIATLLAVAVLAVTLLSSGCRANGNRGGGGEPNVLLITLDTTRVDRLGCYGHPGGTSPAIDGLATSGVRFETAYSQVPLTLPSHASLLTGTYPGVNGLHVNGSSSLGASLPTLAESFSAKGFRTGAFVSSFVLHRVFGLARGFDHYDDDLAGARGSSAFQVERGADEVTEAALAWLGASADRPFFAWVHYYDPHIPYDPPEEFRSRFDDTYDGEIAFMDAQIGRLIRWLEGEGLRDDTVVVVVADHGESFDEHREPQHGLFVYDTTMRVPMILSWPARLPRGATVEQPARLVDLFPTLLELMGWSAAPDLDGRSLVAALEGKPLAPLPVYGESAYARLGYGWAPLRFIVDEPWKYIEAPQPELYDRSVDPGETRNVLTDNVKMASDLRERLIELEIEMVPRETGDVQLDGEALEGLRALGYLGGGDGGDALDGLRDPKEMIDVYRGHLRAMKWIKEGRPEEGAQLLEQLVAESPESDEMYDSLGSAYLAARRPIDAQRAFENSLRTAPGHPMRLWGLAEALRRQGDFPGAIEQFQKALLGRPDLGEAHRGLTVSYANLGDFQKAYVHGRRHVEINSTSTNALINLANICLTIGKPAEAAEALEKTLALEPRNTMAHYTLWEALHSSGRQADALGAARRGLSVMPGDIELGCALGWLLAVSSAAPADGAAEALELSRRCVDANPGNPRGHDVLAAAHAANGDFDAAVASIRRAIERAQGPAAPLRPAFEARLRLYESNQRYLE